MHQFNPSADADLNAMEELLGNEQRCPTCQTPRGIIPAMDALKGAFDRTWATIFAIFDRQGEKGAPQRFVTQDGYTLSRQVTSPEERLDETALRSAMERTFQRAEADKLWAAVTDPGPRVLNQKKLAKAVQGGKLPAAIVQAGMIRPAGVTSRNRRKATKEDIAFLQLFAQQEDSQVKIS